MKNIKYFLYQLWIHQGVVRMCGVVYLRILTPSPLFYKEVGLDGFTFIFRVLYVDFESLIELFFDISTFI